MNDLLFLLVAGLSGLAVDLWSKYRRHRRFLAIERRLLEMD